MPTLRRVRRVLCFLSSAFMAIGILSACGSSQSSLPTASSSLPIVTKSSVRTASISPAAADIVAINVGGGATGSFAADEYNVSPNSWTTKTSQQTIDTTLIANPAPQAVYKSQRTGTIVSYTIPGLTAGTMYSVALSFAELAKTGPGQRVFNVSLNGSQVLSNFDIFAAAGASHKAVEKSFSVAASSAGTIAIVMNSVVLHATLNAIEISPVSASPSPSPTPSLVDWPSYGYDVARTGYNPNTTSLTPASISQLHIAWQQLLKSDSSRSQPIVVTNIAGHAALVIVAKYNVEEAHDALTGALVWQTTLPLQDVNKSCGGASGIAGTAAYDNALRAIFVAAGNGNPAPNHVILYRLDVATGATTGQVDVTPTLLTGESNHAHGGIAFTNGEIYFGTSSDCEGSGAWPMWRGRVVSVDPASMTLLNTFFTTWGQGGNYGGGGVWGWGGVSSDPTGNIYVATGNAANRVYAGVKIPPPFVASPTEHDGYGEHLVKLDSNLALQGADYPGFNFAGHSDLDFSGTPVVFQPPSCGALVATQGKGGTLVVNNSSDASKVSSFAFAVPSSDANYIGNPGYSPATGYLYAAISSAGSGTSLLPPGLAAITGCGTSIAWHAQFGPDAALVSGSNPRSAPTVTAGGVVFMATPCVSNGSGGCAATGSPLGGALWAVDASTGTVLGGGNPLLITASRLRMAPSVDGDWLFVIDDGGNLYGLTIDAAVKAVSPKAGFHIAPAYYKGD